MPKLVRNKPDPLPEGKRTLAVPFTERDSVDLDTKPNSVRRGLEADRILFDESTDSTEQPSVEPVPEEIFLEILPTLPDSVVLRPKAKPVRSELEVDRTEFGAVTDSTEQASVTLPRGTKAVLKAPVNEAERRPFDDYPTEPGWTHALLDSEEFPGLTLEPAAGAGWMVQTLEERGLDVCYSDLERDGLDFLADDYLDRLERWEFDNVVTNPPYKFLDAFAAKALEVAQHKVALLLPDFALVGVNRTKDLWQAHPPKKMILVASKMKVLGKVSMFPHVWAVWDKDYEGPTVWEWAVVPKELRIDTNKNNPTVK